MLKLDDPAWKELWHCYGDGSDVPPKLLRIENSEALSRAFWDDFSNMLCHQCTIGTASIAAFPHLVRIAGSDARSKKALHCMELAALILTLALGPENQLPKLEKRLDKPFRQAIAEGRPILLSMYDQKRRSMESNMRYLGMIAAFDLRADIASFLSEVRLGWLDCPRCEAHIEINDLCTW